MHWREADSCEGGDVAEGRIADIVFTGVTAPRYADRIYAQMCVTYTLNG